MTLSGVDLFAGAGGWDVYCAELGIDVLGIETDRQACETRAAAGFRTLQADVSKLDPADYPCDVLIASPPCTAFSMAGKGKGRDALAVFATAIQRLRVGASLDREWLDSQCDDLTAHLVLEPLRWALALQPALIAFEQVPPVLPLWRLMADVLRERGYSTWTGVLEAERFGVPQTRGRAILMASRTGQHVCPPVPTHQRYVSGEPARHEMTLDGELLPWVSMAQALGWDGSMASEPAFALTEKARSWIRFRSNNLEHSASRGADEPAPTITGGHDYNERRWELRAGTNDHDVRRSVDESAATVRFGGRLNDVSWVFERPATTVAGDPRIAEPGWRGSPRDYDANGKYIGQRSMDNAVRVSLAEALVLQSFPADYPVQGTKTAQFRQIGDAVPPLMALAVLKAVV